MNEIKAVACDVCKGSGQICTGSTLTEVGYEPHLEPCDNCNHGITWPADALLQALETKG